jgi:predicted anti-sigma-YlaC factor YlaD
MRCSLCRDQQHEYEREELAAAELREVEEHLAHCTACRQYYRELGRLRELLTPVESATPRRDAWPRLAARIAERQRRAKSFPRRALRPALALATAAAGVALALNLLGGTPQPLGATAGIEALVENSEAGMVWTDPWAGDVAQALDWVLADQT